LSSLVPRPLPPEEWPGTYCLRMRVILRYILRKKRRALTHPRGVVRGMLYYPRIRIVFLDEMSDLTCRICLSAIESKHSTALFTAAGLSQEWPSRIGELLCVEIVKGDGLPNHICRSCKGRVISIEGKLQSLRALAQESFRKLQDKRSSDRKRSKDTSGGLGVSPNTANVRPPAKRQYGLARRSLFSSDGVSSTGEF